MGNLPLGEIGVELITGPVVHLGADVAWCFIKRRWSKEIKREDGLSKMKLGHDAFCITVR